MISSKAAKAAADSFNEDLRRQPLQFSIGHQMSPEYCAMVAA
jgi:hypothetical protein